jgi:hypothetical protein
VTYGSVNINYQMVLHSFFQAKSVTSMNKSADYTKQLKDFVRAKFS